MYFLHYSCSPLSKKKKKNYTFPPYKGKEAIPVSKKKNEKGFIYLFVYFFIFFNKKSRYQNEMWKFFLFYLFLFSIWKVDRENMGKIWGKDGEKIGKRMGKICGKRWGKDDGKDSEKINEKKLRKIYLRKIQKNDKKKKRMRKLKKLKNVEN
ncbi:hypothetical protein RFI_25497 [Reticulomyxa filosa]|uniref:Uncharacterized protein n=1 Tax=Reticulomyxa filosa TaxID=46433 RepID=X6MDE7_RETFI|nr:hypothetical protein RFI_25497 [Reticulomyxa filosa]|eukprot:ETO11879.1 hypothetical protein RFI_25497 [Reticulomyxa filosa]